MQRNPHCCNLLCSNAESCCEIDASQRGQKPLNTETYGSVALEAVTRQPVKTEQTEKA
jgi:hypothetical protein